MLLWNLLPSFRTVCCIENTVMKVLRARRSDCCDTASEAEFLKCKLEMHSIPHLPIKLLRPTHSLSLVGSCLMLPLHELQGAPQVLPHFSAALPRIVRIKVAGIAVAAAGFGSCCPGEAYPGCPWLHNTVLVKDAKTTTDLLKLGGDVCPGLCTRSRVTSIKCTDTTFYPRVHGFQQAAQLPKVAGRLMSLEGSARAVWAAVPAATPPCQPTGSRPGSARPAGVRRCPAS
jgi:hypothetical protein